MGARTWSQKCGKTQSDICYKFLYLVAHAHNHICRHMLRQLLRPEPIQCNSTPFSFWFFHLQSSLSSSSSSSKSISSSSSSSQITLRTNTMQSFYSYGITSPTFPNSESIPFSQQDSTNTIMYYYYANILLLFRSIDSIVGCHCDFAAFIIPTITTTTTTNTTSTTTTTTTYQCYC